MTAALLNKPDAKRTSPKVKRIRPFYYSKGRELYQRDASTDHVEVRITSVESETIAAAIAVQLNRSELRLALIAAMVDALNRAFGDPARRFLHPKVSLCWRSAREELAAAERDGV
jgi:hypothetical protein